MKSLNQLLQQHVFASYHKQLNFASWAGKLEWQFDMSDGLLVLGGKHRFSAQVLGSESHYNDTWQWAWANTAGVIPEVLQKAALAMKKYGEDNGVGEFKHPMLGNGKLAASYISLVASGLLNVGPYYRGPYDGGAMYLLIVDKKFPPCAKNDALEVGNVIQTVISSVPVENHHYSIGYYLKWLGLPVKATESSFLVSGFKNGQLSLEFDQQKRVTAINTQVAAGASGR